MQVPLAGITIGLDDPGPGGTAEVGLLGLLSLRDGVPWGGGVRRRTGKYFTPLPMQGVRLNP